MSRPPGDPALGRRRLLSGVAVAGAFGVSMALAPPIATAAGAGDDPPVLRQRITDVARRLGPLEKEEVATELERIETEDGVRLFVVLVDSTGERTATELARAAAEASSLGGNEALLLIAFDQPSDALWVGPSLGQVTSAEIQRILTEHVERNLASGDVEQALLDGAYAVGAAATGDLGSIGSAPPARSAGPVPMTQGNEGRRQPGISPSDVVPAILVLAIVAVVTGGLFAFRQREAASSRPRR
jgi:uncharacterized membrane protein YgcG